MAKNREQLNNLPPGELEDDFSLEEILAEYTDTGLQDEPGDSIPIPVDVPSEAPDNVIPFPANASPLSEGIRRLRQAEDAYTERMFEDAEPDPELLRAEALIPGADVEQVRPRRERKPRFEQAPAPDLPPAELSRVYGKGLKSLRLRSFAVFLLAFLLIFLAVAPSFGVVLPSQLADSLPLQVYLSAWLLAVAMLLGADALGRGLLGLVRGRPGMDALTALACAATLADSVTMLRLGGRGNALPYCGTAALGLGFTLWGTYLKRKGLRQACRTAASAAEPYLVTLDEAKWDGRDAYTKTSAPLHGFGSQIQSDDGAQRIFHRAVPLLLLSCLLLSMISALGTRRPEHLLWCLSATLTACASFSGFLCFGMPMASLSVRLAKSGAALAGWMGVRWSVRGNGILLTDTDLFPPGSVCLNGIKIFGDYSVEKVVAVTATLIKASGCGLDKIFHDLLRTQGTACRQATEFCCYEGGGVSAIIRGELVLVGTAAFMSLMDVALPQGLGVKNAVFCAIDGDLAGIFALNYTLQSTISPALTALIHNKVSPVLATRDFNLIPSMLRQRFKLPVDKMEFPTALRRMELSETRQEHSSVITAVLCREGVGPFSEAVVGARRLRRATRLSAGLAAVGSVVGLLLVFYLTYVSAYASLSVVNLTAFLLLWTVPTLLISGWVDRY